MVKWVRLRQFVETVWLSAFAGSNPVSHILMRKNKEEIPTKIAVPLATPIRR